MAIIKHLKRLGATIRGAKTGRVCTFDKDGNVISSERAITQIPAPSAANTGKVWTCISSGSTGWADVPTELPEIEEGDEGKILGVNEQGEAQWEPHYPPTGSTGDVLTLGESGVEWDSVDRDISALITWNSKLQVTVSNAKKIGKIIFVSFSVKTREALDASTAIILASVDSSIAPSADVYTSVVSYLATANSQPSLHYLKVTSGGYIVETRMTTGIPADAYYVGAMIYILP